MTRGDIGTEVRKGDEIGRDSIMNNTVTSKF